jgi:YD repeat-containing protein
LVLEHLEDRILLSVVNWINTAGGDWDTPGNWSTGQVPGAADDAVITYSNITVTHDTNSSDSINSITSQAGLILSGGTLTVASTLDSTNAVTLEGGTLTHAIVTPDTTITSTPSGGTLNGVTLNGTLDMTQNSGAQVTVINGLTLNSTIELGGASGTSNYASLFFGSSGDGFAQTVSGTGTIQFGLNSGAVDYLYSFSNETLTFGPSITIQGGVNSQIDAQSAGIDNQGTIAESTSGGQLTVNAIDWTNAGSINVSNGASAALDGSWSNSATGQITVTGATLNLGDQSSSSANAWSNAGTISASNSTVNLGGLFTLAGLGRFTPSSGTVNLVGTLDNMGTTLALDATTGSWNLLGGTLEGGTYTASGGAELIVTSTGGTLDGVTLNGTLDMTQYSGAQVTVINGLTLNSTIELGGASGTSNNASLFFGSGGDGVAQTVSGTGTIQFGQNSGAVDYLYSFSNETLTFGPSVTIQGGVNSQIDAPSAGIDNQGTESTSGGFLDINCLSAFENAGVVTVGSGAALSTGSQDYTQTAGSTTVDGTLSTANLNLNGGSLDGTGIIQANVINAAVTTPGDQPGMLTIEGSYTQASAGALDIAIASATQLGQLAVTGSATLDGTLNVSLLNGFTPQPGSAFTLVQQAVGTISGIFAGLPEGSIFQVGNASFQITYQGGTGSEVVITAIGAVAAPSTTTVSSNLPSGSSYGQIIAFTATVSGSGFPTGTVQFQIDGSSFGTPVSLSGGNVTIYVAALSAGTHTIAAYYSGDQNFQASNGSLGGGQLVTPATLTVTANDASMIYGGPLPTFTASYSGFVNGDTPGSLTAPASFTTSATVTSAVGSYPITPSGATDPNYAITFLSGTLTVVPLQAIISLDTASDSGAPDHPDFTNVTTPTFDVQVNEGGTITVDLESNGEFVTTLSAPTAGTYKVTAPTSLADGAFTATAVLDSITGVTAQSSMAYTIDTVGPYVTSMSPTGTVNNGVSMVIVTFSKSIDLGSFLPSAITLTGPGGTVVVNPPQLVSGTTYSISFPTQTLAGGYSLTIGTSVTDFAANPMANAFTGTFVLVLPDLQVAGVSGPASGFTGQTVLVSWTDQNNGACAATGPWTDNIYAATDAQGDNPTLLGSFIVNQTLAAGASAQFSQQFTLPQTAGTYWLMVTTNAGLTLTESSYSNDTTVAASSINVAMAPLPDLVVSSITVPTSAVLSGTSVPISFVVTNQGTAPTSVPVWQDIVIVSQDPTLIQLYNSNSLTGDQFLADILKSNLSVLLPFKNASYLDVGQSYEQNVNVTLQLPALGTWYVYVVPDGLQSAGVYSFSMRELSRTDKIAISAGFTVNLTPPPALDVTSVLAPSQDFSGQPMTLSWTVANQGTGPTVATSWIDAVYMSPDSTLDQNSTLLGNFEHGGALAVGDSYTSSQTLILPVGVSGSFYFLVQTDTAGQVFQNGNTAGNVGVTTFAETVNLTPPPDLEVTSIVAPPTALASHALTFTYTIANAGAGGTPNTSWDDSFSLSPTATYDSSTAIILDVQSAHQGTLAPGDSYTNSVTETIPNGLTGSYYLLVDTDSGGQVFELDKTNNWGASIGTIAVSSAPADLVVSAANGPASALAGSAVLVNWTVTNQGIGDSAVTSWQDKVYADTGSTVSSNAVLLDSFTHTGLLDAGAFYSQSQLVTLPISLLGPYNLFVVTNGAVLTSPVYESDFNNDTSTAVPIMISQQLADLQVSSVTGPASAVTGSSVSVGWSVQNNGLGETNSNYWSDAVWMSTNAALGLFGGTDVLLGKIQHTNPLAAGANYSASGTFSIPLTVPAGSYYFIIVTNSDSKVYDSDSSNSETATSTTAAVSVTPTPELDVSSVTAPNLATTGGQLSVGWKVTNNGADTGNVPIIDSVYIVFDQALDSTARYLGSVTYAGSLAAGASYTQNTSLQLPAGVAGLFYVFVQTNGDGNVFELNPGNNTAYDAQPVTINLPPPADLVAGTITIPANAVAGQEITLTYQVSNTGTNAADGSWYDALYLSPTKTWSVTDSLLGKVYQTQNVAPGGSYMGTLNAALPGIAPGPYYVILRSNILDSFPEVTLSNNLIASLTQTLIDASALPLGIAVTGTRVQGQSYYYKVQVTAGQTLQISLDCLETFGAGPPVPDPLGSNRLYASFGVMPTLGHYEYSGTGELGANPRVTIPTTQAGTYYILVYCDSVQPPETLVSFSYTLTASLVPFSITAVAPAQVGTGEDTIEIDGSKFAANTTFQLLGPSNAVVYDQKVFLQDSSTAFATFNLSSMPTGTYTAQAMQADGTTTQLTNALSVVPATPANIHLYLSYPGKVLPGSQNELAVNYINESNTDAEAPLLQLTATSALLALAIGSSFTSAPIWVLGISSNGPAGTLRPGETGQLVIPFHTTGSVGQNINFDVQIADDSKSIDWATQESALQLPTIPDAAWPAVFANFVANVGNTVASYHVALEADATYLSELGEPTYNVLQLVSFEIEKANASFIAQTLATVTAESLPAPGVSLSFVQSFQQSIAGRYTAGILGNGWTTNWDISALTTSNGNVAIKNNGVTLFYFLQPNGSYTDEVGDHSVLALVNSAYQLTTKDSFIYQFNPNGTLGYVQDSNGNRITTAFNAAGQLVSLTDSNGEFLALTYNAAGHLAQLADSTGQIETYAYDPADQFLTSYSDIYGTTNYTYLTGQTPQQNNALSEIAYADNTHIYFAYDSQGRLIDQHRDGLADDTSFSYLSPAGYVATDGDLNQTTTLFNLFGATAETVDALGNVVRYKYDSNLNLVAIDDPQGTRYTGTYDSNGNLTGVTDPLGHTTTFTYNGNNRLTSYTDAKGNATLYSYDNSNNLLSITYANGIEQQYSYNPLGEATQYLNARGHAINYGSSGGSAFSS